MHGEERRVCRFCGQTQRLRLSAGRIVSVDVDALAATTVCGGAGVEKEPAVGWGLRGEAQSAGDECGRISGERGNRRSHKRLLYRKAGTRGVPLCGPTGLEVFRGYRDLR